MKRKTSSILLSMCFIALMFCCHSAVASPYEDFDFDDITYWVGEGENQAAMVIQWATDEGEAISLAWGYRWDGTAYAIDMMGDIAQISNESATFWYAHGDDSRLYMNIKWYGSGLGYAIVGMGYDVDGDGFTFVADEDHGHAGDPDDVYNSGWEEDYWSYWVYDEGDTEFSYSGLGASSRPLSDGSWDGWGFSGVAEYGVGVIPGTPVSAPLETLPVPGAIVLLGSGLLGIIGIRRKK